MKKLLSALLIFFCANAFAQVSSVMKTGVKYHIQSATNYNRDNGGYFDVPGSGDDIIKSDANIQVWNLDGGKDRFFTLHETDTRGYYEISIGDANNLRLVVSGGNKANGTSVVLGSGGDKTSRMFRFNHLGNGRYKIFNANGNAITLADRSSANGKNVHMWGDHDGIWMEWFLLDPTTKQPFIPTESVRAGDLPVKGDEITTGKNFKIQTAQSYGRNNNGYWDLPGKGSDALKQGANIQIWALDNYDDRLFRFERKAGSEYYQIYVGKLSDGVVDLSAGKTDNGTNVQMWKANGGSAQNFYLKHLGNGRFKIYHQSGKIINLKNTNEANGNNVHLWNDHNGIHCEWYLIDPTTNKAYIPSDNSNNSGSGGSGSGGTGTGGSGGRK